jgi:hypothetical protein
MVLPSGRHLSLRASLVDPTISILDLLPESESRIAAWIARYLPPNRSNAAVHLPGQLMFLGGEMSFSHFEVGAITFKDAPPEVVDTITFINDSATQDSLVYASKKTTAASVSFQATRAVKTGINTSVKIPIPYIGGDFGINATHEVSFTDARTTQQNVSQEWSWSQTLYIPARSRVDVVVSVAKQIATVPIKAKGRLIRCVLQCQIQYAPSGPWYPFSPGLGPLFLASPHPAVTVPSPPVFEARVEGVFDIQAGTRITIIKKQAPLGQDFRNAPTMLF